MQTLITFFMVTMLAFTSLTLYAASKEDQYAGIAITVNINTADAEELAALLQGVGPERAKDIVEYRKQHGVFQSADELTAIKGIGAATVNKNRDRIQLSN